MGRIFCRAGTFKIYILYILVSSNSLYSDWLQQLCGQRFFSLLFLSVSYFLFAISIISHFLILSLFITGHQSQCSNCRPKVGPGNDYMSFHGQADETKSRLPAGYLILALDWIFLYFSKCDILNLQRLEANFLNWGVNMVKPLGKIKVGPLTAVTEYDFSCHLLRLPLFPSSSGYNTVVRIPAGATNIDIKQVSYSGKPEDDNYLGECALHMSQSVPRCGFQRRAIGLHGFLQRLDPTWKRSNLISIYYTPWVFVSQVNAIIP